MDAIKQLENKIHKAKIKEEVIKKTLKNDFFTLVRQVLENKNIKALYWTQYTPYFNDGEPCVFRVNDLCCVVDKQFLEIEERYRKFIGTLPNKKAVQTSSFFYHVGTDDDDVELEIKNYSHISILKNINQFAKEEKNMSTIFLMAKLSELMTEDYFEKVLLETIGDHSKITISNIENNMEVNIESYEHD